MIKHYDEIEIQQNEPSRLICFHVKLKKMVPFIANACVVSLLHVFLGM